MESGCPRSGNVGGHGLRREQEGNVSTAREGATRYLAIFFTPARANPKTPSLGGGSTRWLRATTVDDHRTHTFGVKMGMNLDSMLQKGEGRWEGSKRCEVRWTVLSSSLAALLAAAAPRHEVWMSTRRRGRRQSADDGADCQQPYPTSLPSPTTKQETERCAVAEPRIRWVQVRRRFCDAASTGLGCVRSMG